MSDREYRDIFGERLREVMYERNMSQAQLAKEAGIGRATVNSWFLNDRIICPRADTLARICDVLSVSMDYLFGRSEEL